MEIERKFLVENIPTNLEKYEKFEIEQGYISKKPIIRIRKSDAECFLTVKSLLGVSSSKDSAIVNNEYECKILKDEYEALLEKIDGKIVKKTRYKIPLGDNLFAELDIFKDGLSGLVIVEVEFESLEKANSFMPPDWFGRDVSKEAEYRNVNLAMEQRV